MKLIGPISEIYIKDIKEFNNVRKMTISSLKSACPKIYKLNAYYK